MRHATLSVLALLIAIGVAAVVAQNPKRAAKPTKASSPSKDAPDLLSLKDTKLQRDFPDLCSDPEGQLWVCYVEHDGKSDTLWLAKKTKDGLSPIVAMRLQCLSLDRGAGRALLIEPSISLLPPPRAVAARPTIPPRHRPDTHENSTRIYSRRIRTI